MTSYLTCVSMNITRVMGRPVFMIFIHLCLVLPSFSSKFNLPAFHLAQVQILFSKSSLPGLAFLPPFLNRNDPATNFKQGPYIIYIHYIFNLLKPWKFHVLQWDIYPVSTLSSIPNHGTYQKNTQSTDLVFKTCQILVCYKTSLYLLSKQQTRLVTGPRMLHRVRVALSDQINLVENMMSDDHTKNHGLWTWLVLWYQHLECRIWRCTALFFFLFGLVYLLAFCCCCFVVL